MYRLLRIFIDFFSIVRKVVVYIGEAMKNGTFCPNNKRNNRDNNHQQKKQRRYKKTQEKMQCQDEKGTSPLLLLNKVVYPKVVQFMSLVSCGVLCITE